jgi:hypothetical protein
VASALESLAYASVLKRIERQQTGGPVGQKGLWAAIAACVIGLPYAGVSVYWGAGGRWLLDTVGGSLARLGHNPPTDAITAVWAAVALKLMAASRPLSAEWETGYPSTTIARLISSKSRCGISNKPNLNT